MNQVRSFSLSCTNSSTSCLNLLINYQIFLIRYRSKPLGVSLLGIGHYRDMGKPAVRYGTMPVFHIWRDLYYIPGVQDPDLPALFLGISFATGDQQDLAPGMFMPVIPCAGLERYIANRAVECPVIRNQHFKPCRPDEMVIDNLFAPISPVNDTIL